jgi:hypothetical protein
MPKGGEVFVLNMGVPEKISRSGPLDGLSFRAARCEIAKP